MIQCLVMTLLLVAKTIYDIDKDGNQELHLVRNYVDSVHPGTSLVVFYSIKKVLILALAKLIIYLSTNKAYQSTK